MNIVVMLLRFTEHLICHSVTCVNERSRFAW